MIFGSGHVLIASNGRFLGVDEAFCTIMRSEPTAILGRQVLDITAPADRQECHAALTQLFKSGKQFEITKRFMRDDGSLFWTKNSVSLARGDGDVEMVIATIQPVVVTDHAPAALLEAAHALIRARQDRASVCDPSVFSDPAWDTVLAAYVAEIEGRSIDAARLAVALDISQALALRWIRVLMQQGILEIEYRSPQPDTTKEFRLTAKTQEKLEAYLGRHMAP